MTEQPATLEVCHWTDAAMPATVAPPGSVLRMRSCQREVWISPDVEGLRDGAGADRSSGEAAYALLLEIVCGLRSQVPGETNIEGQFRRAWDEFRTLATTRCIERLAPAINRLLSDAQAIRRVHLQGIGGASYGSLLRKLIRPGRDDRVLIIGTGALARSVLPFFRHRDVGLWHYRALATLPDSVERAFAPDDGRTAAAWATHVVLTTPPNRRNDDRWTRWLRDGQAQTVTHLGHRRGGDPGFGDGLPGPVFLLDDLFDLRERQANVRSLQVERAKAACRTMAAAWRQRTSEQVVERRAIA